MRIEVNGETAYCYTNSRQIMGDKPSIVFIHGSGMDHTVWTLASRHFARHGNNVVSVDLPGHGRSTGSALATVEAMASWVLSVLDALDIPDAALVGHSLGSLIALECAASHSDRVRAIALLGTTSPMPVSDAILNAAEVDDHAAFDMLTQWASASAISLAATVIQVSG